MCHPARSERQQTQNMVVCYDRTSRCSLAAAEEDDWDENFTEVVVTLFY